MNRKELSESIENTISNGDKLDAKVLTDCIDTIKDLNISFGYTPITFSGLYGNTEAIKSFISAGIDINQRDSNKFTALFTATRKKKLETVKCLLKLGANPDIACTDHAHTALFEALLWDHQEVAEILIKNGANIHISGKSGLTALHIAASRNLQGIVELLLNNNADIFAKDKDGKTPIDYAKENEHLEVISIFERYSQSKNRDKLYIDSFVSKLLEKLRIDKIVNLINRAKFNFEKYSQSKNSDKLSVDSSASVALAKLQIDKIVNLINRAKYNKIYPLIDELVIQLANEIQKIVIRGYSYKYDATLADALRHQMNCQSRAAAFLSIFQEASLGVDAVISPGHVVLVYKLSNGSLLVMDDVLRITSDYKIKKINKSSVLIADIFPSSKWGMMGNPEKVLLSSYFQMLALKKKISAQYDMAVRLFEKAIELLPEYSEFHFGLSLALKFSGKATEAKKEEEIATELEILISE